MESAIIFRLHIQRFRGIKSLLWHPQPELNIILGGGDAGKSTILDAVALLLYPSSGYALSDADYFQREVDQEFEIEAVIAVPGAMGMHNQTTMSWPWNWDTVTRNASLPVEGDEAEYESVFKIRVRGSPELELIHEIIQPDETAVVFNVAMRRAIGIVKLAADDRNERDLRLIQGAGLNRLLNDKTLRGKISRRFALQSVEEDLSSDARAKLDSLDVAFKARSLPTNLAIGFIGGSGVSIGSLMGLTSGINGVALPIASWGAGTRRLASLAIADSLQEKHSITVIDEVERGLEPYRQRKLVSNLKTQGNQIFLTSHSATVISAAAGASLWYLDANGSIGFLDPVKISELQKSDPEVFLARLAIIAEGITEVGFLANVLDQYLPGWKDIGLTIADARGNDHALKILEGLSSANLTFAGFADDEGRFEGRWANVHQRLGNLMFRWGRGCLEENLIHYCPREKIFDLIDDPEGEKTGMRLSTLADHLQIKDRSFPGIVVAARDQGISMFDLIVEAALGRVPVALHGTDESVKKPFKGHPKIWFKSLEGGKELATKLHTLQIWPHVRADILPFINAIRITAGLARLPEESHE